MKVLICAIDVFSASGGGQTVYRTIIEKTADISFYYFRLNESPDCSRPPNAIAIPLIFNNDVLVLSAPPTPKHYQDALKEADRFARSVSGCAFDVVDVPDFSTFGAFIRSAMKANRVQFGKLVLALHGNISTSIELNWQSSREKNLETSQLEYLQFLDADVVYGISSRYAKEWAEKYEREISLIDPAHFIRSDFLISEPYSERKAHLPSLYCVGRFERRKGHDLFVSLLPWLRKGSYARAIVLGQDEVMKNGVPASNHFKSLAAHRGVQIDIEGPKSFLELRALYSDPTIMILPVRYDTLNLVALETIASGCPVAISDRAGLCDYLDQCHPGIPYLKIKMDSFLSTARDVQGLIDNYDDFKSKLASHLKKHPLNPKCPLDMKSIYQKLVLEGAKAAPNHFREIAYAGSSYSLSWAVRGARIVFGPLQLKRVKNLLKRVREFRVVPFLHKRIKTVKLFGLTHRVTNELKALEEFDETSSEALRAKLQFIYNSSLTTLFRCNSWLELARIERLKGNELVAATYELRCLRAWGKDELGLLPRVAATLEKNGFIHEASATRCLYENPDRSEEKVLGYLSDKYQINLKYAPSVFERLEEIRKPGHPKVSVVVSLFKAASKLDFFLNALLNQTLLKKGAVEIVLIDSGSPTDEYSIFKDFAAKNPLVSIVYGRTAKRETIQGAWNRGIELARAPYLVFLGVDETLYPESLDILAKELDAHPEVDWVMGDSHVTEVEETGLYKNDVMEYLRTDATKEHVYLETCYLSWVGGMYRKSIHERFGFYDDTFRAAGDTEFKNRVLPFIKVKFISNMLGLFLNYPDGQTTASPVAEIEDLRAWYLHRSPGGIRYAFDGRDISAISSQLIRSLSYRKSYCRHLSTDFEYALNVSTYLGTRNASDEKINKLVPGLNHLLAQLRSLEWTQSNPSTLVLFFKVLKAFFWLKFFKLQHQKLVANNSWLNYSFNNDNRYEQHSWFWRTV